MKVQADTFERSCEHWSDAGRDEMEAFYELARVDYRHLAEAYDWADAFQSLGEQKNGARLRLVEAPLAALSILAGIKTAAVINIGAATLGALIGAGGYGQPILTGIRLDDVGLILEGAVPAAGLAIVVQLLFEWAERAIVPRSLRTSTRA
jgi:ABC-type proline/glycine betaine transport system permease subunit